MNSARPTPDTCGCCEGVEAQTPASITNRPGLSALAYRVGTHASFKASMQVGLSRFEALRALQTRDADDPSSAVIDAWATVLDVLTFYQERIANEAYLQTATERRSVLEMAQAIGYELSPGVAASTDLAFEIETLPRVPQPAPLPSTPEAFPTPGVPDVVTIEVGTKVQSLPGPGEKPQTFETIETLEARPTWNTLAPRQTQLRLPAFGDDRLYLKGVTTNLKPGDPLLIVGQERAEDISSERWEFRRVSGVKPDTEADRTLVRWSEPLGSTSPRVAPPQQEPKVYALRLRAALFGHNAPAWRTLPVALRVGEIDPNPNSNPPRRLLSGAYADRATSWSDKTFDPGTTIINLDTVYNQLTRNSWLVLAAPTYVELYQVTDVAEETKADFNLTAKTTRLEIAGENIEKFSPQTTSVYTQPEELELAETPLTPPVWQDGIVLDQKVEGLPRDRTLILRGKRIRLQIDRAPHGLSLTSLTDASVSKPIQSRDEFIVLERPADVAVSPKQKQWLLRDMSGFEGMLTLSQDQWTFAPSAQADPLVTERATLKRTTAEDETHTTLHLTQFLTHVYDRATVTICANVARATHGETKHEVLGSGDAAQTFQQFGLKQTPPLTFVSAPTPSGTASTLEVRVNDIPWQEAPSGYGRTSRQQNYIARLADTGEATVQFGDGVSGARLPSGTENVVATYRVGTGLAGMLKAGQLSLLMTRPLGVKGVTNPLAPTGAADPEQLSDARQNAPFTVLTLDRVVSLQDYENFARAFAGIGKAQATWLWDRDRRLVHLTLAAADGGAVDDTSRLYHNLQRAIESAGDGQPFRLDSYQPLAFAVQAKILVDRRCVAEKVKAAATAALQQAFSFQERAFGQPVTQSEVLAAIQAVDGIIAVDLDTLAILGKQEDPDSTGKLPKPKPLLLARRAHWDDSTSSPQLRPAELLTLDPQAMTLTEMQA